MGAWDAGSGEQRRIPARGLHLLAEAHVTPALRTGVPASATVGIPAPPGPMGTHMKSAPL